ncbi:MAG: hypothetical protein WBD07_18095 [Vicinamibacterales bacterium]
MTRSLLRGSSAVGIGVMLLVGVVRTQDKAKEREEAVRKLCVAESPALGSGARGASTAGTPETTLLSVSSSSAQGRSAGGIIDDNMKAFPVVSTTPGSVVDLTIKGKFVVGTHFVFHSDWVQVVKEKVLANSYEVTLRVAATAGPAVVEVQAFSPVRCGPSARIPALVIGGKFAWDLAGGGWKLQLRSEGAGLALTAGGKFEEIYDAEFFRGTEPKPYTVRKATLAPVGEGLYSLVQSAAPFETGAESVAALQDRIMKRMVDPTVSDAEKEKLSKEFSDALEKFAQQTDAAVEKQNTSFVCQPGSLRWDGRSAQAKIDCNTGTLNLTGTLKPVR